MPCDGVTIGMGRSVSCQQPKSRMRAPLLSSSLSFSRTRFSCTGNSNKQVANLHPLPDLRSLLCFPLPSLLQSFSLFVLSFSPHLSSILSHSLSLVQRHTVPRPFHRPLLIPTLSVSLFLSLFVKHTRPTFSRLRLSVRSCPSLILQTSDIFSYKD